MTYRLRLEIPDLPMLQNKLNTSHWSVRHKEAKKWKRVLGYYIGNKGPKSPLEKAKLELTRHSSVEPDYDGMVGSFKSIIDALKFNGVIKDDKPNVIGEPKYQWQKASPRKGMITVKVEEI